MTRSLRIGIDLDNTIVSYDAVFEALARERGIATPVAAGMAGPAGKKGIRDAVRSAAGNDVWTELQGLAYGPRMTDAVFMPGAEDFLKWAARERPRIDFFVVSHKTTRSAIGGHDLHEPAKQWMRTHGFFSKGASTTPGMASSGLGLELGRSVFLEETREAKFARIAALSLTHFIDDLEEFLTDPAFPKGVERILYASASAVQGVRSLKSWSDISEYFKRTVTR